MISELVLVGDEAWTPEELARATSAWERRNRRTESLTARDHRLAYQKAYRAAHREQRRAWLAANREKVRAEKRAWWQRNRLTLSPEQLEARRAYNREWLRRNRKSRAIGSLHALRCTGPTRATGCRCTKVSVYEVAA